MLHYDVNREPPKPPAPPPKRIVKESGGALTLLPLAIFVILCIVTLTN